MLEVVDRPAAPTLSVDAPPSVNASTTPSMNASETPTNASLLNHSVAQLIESSPHLSNNASQSMEANGTHASLSTPPPFSFLGSDCSNVNLVNFNAASGLTAHSNQGKTKLFLLGDHFLLYFFFLFSVHGFC